MGPVSRLIPNAESIDLVVRTAQTSQRTGTEQRLGETPLERARQTAATHLFSFECAYGLSLAHVGHAQSLAHMTSSSTGTQIRSRLCLSALVEYFS